MGYPFGYAGACGCNCPPAGVPCAGSCNYPARALNYTVTYVNTTGGTSSVSGTLAFTSGTSPHWAGAATLANSGYGFSGDGPPGFLGINLVCGGSMSLTFQGSFATYCTETLTGAAFLANLTCTPFMYQVTFANGAVFCSVLSVTIT